jgi:translation initiation factor 4E
VVNNIPGVSQLQNQSDYFFFRDGIAPMWEDEKNVGGGMFAVTLGSSGPAGGRSSGGTKLDWEVLWLNSLMAAVGSAVGHHAAINGINFGRRTRGDRIQIWMGPTTDTQRHDIERDLLAALAAGLPPQMGQAWYLKFSTFSSGGGDHGGHGRRDSARRESRGGPQHHHHHS